MAADLFIYIDDVRNTAPNEKDCWEGAHQVCCRMTWLGIQDAARKRNYPSQIPRAWAGTIAGTRMIQAGIDGLSRGDKAEGISLGMSTKLFIPIHLLPLDRNKLLEKWIRSLWGEDKQGKLELLEPEGWYDSTMKVGQYLWNVAPAAGEAAVEQLGSHIHGRPENTHIFLIPRLCTCHWRKQLGKICDIVLTIEPIHKF